MTYLQYIKAFFGYLLKLWKKFSEALGWVNSRIIFTIIYIVFFGAYALVIGLIRALKDRKKKNADTFWQPKKYQSPTLEILRRSF